MSTAVDHDRQRTLAQNLVLEILRQRLLNDRQSLPHLPPETWSEAITFAGRQRVIQLLHDWIRKLPGGAVPETILDDLKKRHLANTVASLRIEAELQKLQREFAAACIPLLMLKGITLSHYLYGSASLRPCGDIDILVKPDDMERAAAILRELGYLQQNEKRLWQEKYLQRVAHHWDFRKGPKGILLELHRFFISRSRSAFIDAADVWERTQTMRMSGASLLIMAPEDLLLYLSVHSAKENWATLLHLYDIAALFVNQADLQWERVLKQADDWHCRRRLLISCALLQNIWQLALPELIEKEIGSRADFAQVSNAVHAQYFTPGSRTRSFLLNRVWFDLHVADRWRDRISLLFFKAVNRLIG